MFSTIPTLASTANLIYSRRSDLLNWFKRFPRLCWAEVKYLATGVEQGSPSTGSGELPCFCPSLRVRLPVVHDIILALTENTATAESVGRVCTFHKLKPSIMEPIMQIVRERIPQARAERYAVL